MVLVRVLVVDLEVLLFDELFGVFDVKVCEELCVWLCCLYDEVYVIMVLVIYDQVEVLDVVDCIVVFYKGCIEQVGFLIDVYDVLVNVFVMFFLGVVFMLNGFLVCLYDIWVGWIFNMVVVVVDGIVGFIGVLWVVVDWVVVLGFEVCVELISVVIGGVFIVQIICGDVEVLVLCEGDIVYVCVIWVLLIVGGVLGVDDVGVEWVKVILM